jgi:capsular polysaccharide transport system permease protein
VNVASSAALQLRAIRALIMRRIRTRYAGSRAGYVWAIVEPMMWVLILKVAFKHGSGGQPPLGTSYEVFFATGIILARSWRTTTMQVSMALTRGGRRQSIPALHRLDATYATWIIEIATTGVVMVLVLACMGLFGLDAAPADPLDCIAAYGALSLFILASGLFFSLLITVAPGLVHFQAIIMMVVFFTSGFTFLVDRMPPQFRAIVVWNPLLHCIEWFREGFYAGYECASLDREYLFSVTVILVLLGLTGERAFRRRATKPPVEIQMDDA